MNPVTTFRQSQDGTDGALIVGAALAGLAGGISAVSIAWRIDSRARRQREARLHRMMVDLLLNALNAGDAVTERHSRRVADLADVLFAAYGFGPDRHAMLRLAALLHDMGKIDDRFFQILHSTAPLTDDQRHRIEQHPHEGADILEPLEQIHAGLMATVEAHHECWDGSGYPRGLTADEIPLGARIISVADVFDALTQPREYREPMDVDAALVELRKGAGSRFDPEVVGRLAETEIWEQWAAIAQRGRREEDSARSAPANGSSRRPGSTARRSGIAERDGPERDQSSSR